MIVASLHLYELALFRGADRLADVAAVAAAVAAAAAAAVATSLLPTYFTLTSSTSSPTGTFTILMPRDPETGELYVVQKRCSTAFEAPTLCKSRSGIAGTTRTSYAAAAAATSLSG